MDLSLLKKRILNDNELNYIESKNNKVETLGGIYAAKEAISKALGSGIGIVSFKDINLFWDSLGAPSARYKDILDIDISISHEKDFVIASAFIGNNILDIKRLGEVKELVKSLPDLKKRSKDSHKGDFGKTAIIGGSKSMTGSVYLSSLASLKAGSGLSYTIVPKEIQNVLEIKLVENIIMELEDNKELFEFLEKMDSIAIGMGMGKDIDYKLFEKILKLDIRKIIDADGLNFISKNRSLLKYLKNSVITPHEMEMSRLIQEDLDYVKANRLSIAKKFALLYNCVVVLKGHETLVTDGCSTYINKTGSSALATAGSGDVLSGIIASNLASNSNIFEASKLSVFLHGLSGEIAGFELTDYSVIARDIIRCLTKAIKIYQNFKSPIKVD